MLFAGTEASREQVILAITRFIGAQLLTVKFIAVTELSESAGVASDCRGAIFIFTASGVMVRLRAGLQPVSVCRARAENGDM
jgi:hypothetical protein